MYRALHLGNLPWLLRCLVWNSMPLRCLLFSSNEEMVQPIWQVLADLGIEGEYCRAQWTLSRESRPSCSKS